MTYTQLLPKIMNIRKTTKDLAQRGKKINKRGSSSPNYMQQVPPGCLIWYSDKSALTLAGCGKYSKEPHTVKWADNISAVNQISLLFTNITMTTVELVQACSVQATSSRPPSTYIQYRYVFLI